MDILLETERLPLRALTPADVDNLTELNSDPEVMRYLTGGLTTPREVIEREILPRFLRWYDRPGGFGHWAAHERSSGAFLGWLALTPEEGESGGLELGYRLRRSVWGQGYATEGSRALLRRAFTELGARRVSATTYQDNLASRRVMEKLGMRLVRTFRMTPEELMAEGTFYLPEPDVWEGDDVEYAIDREEWERQNAAS